jgi:hypothetical protein
VPLLASSLRSSSVAGTPAPLPANGKDLTWIVTGLDVEAAQPGVPRNLARMRCVPETNNVDVLTLPIGLPGAPITGRIAKGVPLSVKRTLPPTGLPVVHVTVAVNTTCRKGRGFVVEAVSVVVDPVAELTVTVVVPVDELHTPSPLYWATTVWLPAGAPKVAVSVAVPVGVKVTSGALPRKVEAVESKKNTVPLGLPGGAPKQSTVAVRVDVPPTATVDGVAVTVVIVGRNCRADCWAIAGDTKAAIPASTTAPAAR